MTADLNNSHGGLSDSYIGQKGTRTRIMSLSSPEFNKLREELKASSLEYQKDEITLREILERLDSGET